MGESGVNEGFMGCWWWGDGVRWVFEGRWVVDEEGDVGWGEND